MPSSDFQHIATVLRPALVQVGMDFFASADDAEDVAQETLVRLWEYCQKIDREPRNIQALAVRIAKNVCIDIHRHRHGTLFVPIESAVEESTESPHALLEQREALRRLRQAMQHLDHRERELLEMRIFHDLSADEIAHQTGIGKRSVLAMVSMAKRKIINLLQRKR